MAIRATKQTRDLLKSYGVGYSFTHDRTKGVTVCHIEDQLTGTMVVVTEGIDEGDSFTKALAALPNAQRPLTPAEMTARIAQLERENQMLKDGQPPAEPEHEDEDDGPGAFVEVGAKAAAAVETAADAAVRERRATRKPIEPPPESLAKQAELAAANAAEKGTGLITDPTTGRLHLKK